MTKTEWKARQRRRRIRRNGPTLLLAVLIISAAVAAVLAACNTTKDREDSTPAPAETVAATITETPSAIRVPTETEEPTPEPTEPPEPTWEPLIRSLDFSAEDADILLRIAMAEAEGESTEGKALVMLVVLNRAWSDAFPGSIREVVFQPGQFSPVLEGGRYWTTEPNEDCYAALLMVLGGWNESQNALFFDACGGSSWAANHCEFLFQYGNHYFYK